MISFVALLKRAYEISAVRWRREMNRKRGEEKLSVEMCV